jgi:hypothetical protein
VNVDDACRLLAEQTRDLSLWRGRAADLETERDTYRMLAQQAIEHCHDLTMTVRRQQASLIRLHDLVHEHVTTPSTTRERRAA